MTRLAILALLLLYLSAGNAFAQSQAVKNCQHAYMCPGVPKVTVATLTNDDKAKIAAAETEAAVANAKLEAVRRKIIEAHGGYLLGECPSGSCFTESGSRLSDEVEWKGDFIIMTKHWIPEL